MAASIEKSFFISYLQRHPGNVNVFRPYSVAALFLSGEGLLEVVG